MNQEKKANIEREHAQSWQEGLNQADLVSGKEAAMDYRAGQWIQRFNWHQKWDDGDEIQATMTIQDKRYQEKKADIERENAQSWPWQEELNQDLVSGTEAMDYSCMAGQWTQRFDWHQKWEADDSNSSEKCGCDVKDDKCYTSQWTHEPQWESELELTSSETYCNNKGDELIDVEVEVASDEEEAAQVDCNLHLDDQTNEEIIKRTREVLQRVNQHRREAPVHRSGKRSLKRPSTDRPRGRSPSRSEQHGTGAVRFAKRAKRTIDEVDVTLLRYSQESCKATFQSGLTLEQLVQDLLDRKVRLSARFLRLTVFEEQSKTNFPILRCIDNRRLWALKEYSKRSGKRVMVKVNFFSEETVSEALRYLQNSDNTPGRDVRIRKGSSKGRNGNSSRGGKRQRHHQR